MNYSSAVPRKDSKSSPRVPVTDSVIQSPTAAEKTKAGVLVWLFFWALISPVFIDLGPFGLPLYRLILIFTVVPCMIMWILGRLGPIRIADLLVLAFTIWAAVCMVFNHGLVAQYEFIGFTFVDTAGGVFSGSGVNPQCGDLSGYGQSASDNTGFSDALCHVGNSDRSSPTDRITAALYSHTACY